MIRTEREYKNARERLEKDKEFLSLQKKALEEFNLTTEEINRAMEPAICFHEQLKDEVLYYERIKRKDFDVLINLGDMGRTLIGLRISLGISQVELARRLDISEAAISRDEKNEYHGITIEKIQKILNALNVTMKSEIELPKVAC